MALTKVTSGGITDGTITNDDINATFDLSSKTVTLPAASVTAHATTPTKTSIEALGIDLPAANLTGTINSARYTQGATSLSGLSDVTVTTSDPAINSNKPVGHLWINKTSGEQFVATDATTGANVWTNTGGGSGDVDPFYSMDFLIIAGAGGAGHSGSGAGGYRNSYSTEASGRNSSSETSLTINAAVVYTISVGSGGTGWNWSSSTNPTLGGNSSISGSNITTVTATGGGNGNGGLSAGNGGSGGGGGNGFGTINQGYDGGNGAGYTPGGGGGAGAVGGTWASPNAGSGGSGLASSITGSAVTRAGGGGGAGTGHYSPTRIPGSGGSGGGGNGGSSGGAGYNGTANTGSGAGGGSLNNSGNSIGLAGTGGSGIVILRMLTSKYSGTTTGSPTVSTSGLDTILTFNGDGSYTG